VSSGRAFRRVRGCSGRTSSTWFLKKVFATMILIGGLSSLTAGGTFALLNSQESNAKSTVASGTLTFSNVVNVTGTTCFSYGGPASPANVNNSCQALFTSSTQNYPGTPVTAKVTITNNGSLDASDLSVYMPGGCTNTTTPGDAAPGGGNPCISGGAQLYLQETDSSFTATTCRFPVPAAPGSCAFTSSLFVFSANYTSTASSLDLGAGPAHGQSRYFIVGMELPSSASNTLQGQAAQFGLTWHLAN
jgi:predicted ribosomally synthesized peptide with SipW-like signal peptide